MKNYKNMTKNELIKRLMEMEKDQNKDKRKDLIKKDEDRKNEEKFSKAFQNSPDVIIITSVSDGKIIEVNESISRIGGFSREELTGKTTFELNLWVSIEARNKFVMELRKYGRVLNFETTFRKKSGEVFTGLISGEFIELNGDTCVLSIIHDISQRKRAEDELKSAYMKLEGIWKVSSIAYSDIKTISDHILSYIVLITGSKYGFYGFMNDDESIMTIHSWSGEAMKNCSMVEKLCNFPISESGIWSEAVKKREPLILNDYNLDHPGKKGLPEGHVSLTNLMVLPFFLHGKITSVAAVSNREIPYGQKDVEQVTSFLESINAIVERKSMEEKLKNYMDRLEEMVFERTVELKEAQEKIIRQEKLSVLGQMAGTVGHEVKNPLGVISNAVYFLKMILSEENETTKDYLEIINSEVRRINKIVGDLMNFSRMETSSDRKKTDLYCIIGLSLERLNIPEKIKVNIVKRTDSTSAYIDPLQIEQVLLNLTTNACEAMKEGGEITIIISEENNYLTLSVKDTGCGISEENQKKIFEPLFTTKTRGIGLGLAITKKLVEVNGGKISMESKAGKGTIFNIYFPAIKDK